MPTKAVRAPLRSRSAFVAIVVPCVKRSSGTSAAPTSVAALTTECSCARTVGTFAVRSSPSARSTASVKVPPTSIPRIATRHVYHGGPTPGLHAAWRRRYERAFVRFPHTAIEHHWRERLRARS